MLQEKQSVTKSNQCGQECEIYSRVCGYYRPVARWNKGKKEEFKERLTFDVRKAGEKC